MVLEGYEMSRGAGESRRRLLAWGLAGGAVWLGGVGWGRTLAAGEAEAAAVLREAARALRQEGATAAGVASWGRAVQGVYRAMALDPALAEATLAMLAGEGEGEAAVRALAEANLAATRAILGTVGQPRSQMPDWQVVAPAPAATLEAHYRAAEAEFGVPWEILAAIHLVETRMGRLRGVSTAGARGPMQFIPETWARFGQGDIEDNRDAIFAAARHQRHHGAPGNLDKSLWHYNPSDRYVRSVRGYAQIMQQDPRHYWLYHAWEVYYTSVRGSLLLPEGYALAAPMSVAAWCDAAPTRCP